MSDTNYVGFWTGSESEYGQLDKKSNILYVVSPAEATESQYKLYKGENLLGEGTDQIRSKLIEVQETLSSAINAEKTRAIAAESGLSEAIDAEETRATGVESSLENKITTETTRATIKENELNTKIDATDAKITAFLANATISSAAVDTLKEIQDWLTKHGTDASDLISQVNALETYVKTGMPEGTTSVFSVIIDAVVDETAAREEKDGELEADIATINNNIEALQATDTELSDSIGENADAITAEKGRAEQAEERLNDAITAINTLIGKKPDNISTVFSGIQSNLAKATANEALIGTRFEGADGTVFEEIKNNRDLINTEETRATAAESSLNTKIDAEITRATNAESTLTTNIGSINNLIGTRLDNTKTVFEEISTNRASIAENKELINSNSTQIGANSNSIDAINEQIAIKDGILDSNQTLGQLIAEHDATLSSQGTAISDIEEDYLSKTAGGMVSANVKFTKQIQISNGTKQATLSYKDDALVISFA